MIDVTQCSMTPSRAVARFHSNTIGNNPTMEVTMQSKYIRYLGVVIAIILTFGLAHPVMSSAASTLHPVVPGGLPTNNAAKAKSVFMQRATADPALASVVARQTGSSSFNPNDFAVAGYSNGAPKGSANSGVTDTGGVSSSQDTSHCNVHSKMLVLINVRTSVKLFVCTMCSNPRLFTQAAPKFHPFSKGTVLRFVKRASKKVQICGVWVTITVKIHGTIHARTWGGVMGQLNARLSVAFHAQVTIETKAKCGSQPTPCQCQPQPGPCNCTPTPQPPPGNCNVTGAYVNGQGNVVNSCGTVILTCNGNQTATYDQNTGQWVCSTPQTPPKPQISCVYPAHVFVGGSDYIWCEAMDPDGSPVTINVNDNSDNFAHVSGTIQVNIRWDGTACPAGWTCFRSTLWGDNVGTAHIDATAVGNGQTSDNYPGDVPIKPDQFYRNSTSRYPAIAL